MLVTLLSPRRSKTEVFLTTFTELTAGEAVFVVILGGMTFLLSSSNSSTSCSHSGSSTFLTTSDLAVFNFLGGEGLETVLIWVANNKNLLI